MYEELIQRLENAAGGPEGIKMAHEAADAIAALQAENAELKQRLDKVNDFEKSQCAKLMEGLSRVEAERDAAISRINAAYEVAWGCDIPSPTIPEYVELHDGMTRVMAVLRGAQGEG